MEGWEEGSEGGTEGGRKELGDREEILILHIILNGSQFSFVP